MWQKKQAGSRLSRWSSESSSQFLFTIYSLLMPVPSTPSDKAPSHFILFHGIHLTSPQAVSMQTTALLPPPYSNIEGSQPASLLENHSWKEGSRHCVTYQALPRTVSPYFALVTSLGLPWLYVSATLPSLFLQERYQVPNHSEWFSWNISPTPTLHLIVLAPYALTFIEFQTTFI